MTIQDYVTEIKQLVELSYANLHVNHWTRMTLVTICSRLENAYLETHLLAVNVHAIENAVQA